MSTNNNNTSSNSEIPLKLSEALEESGIIHKFVIDTKDKYVRLRLNSKYNPPVSLDVSLSVIKEKNGWEKFSNKFRDDLRKFFKINNDHVVWIYITVNENGSLIRSYVLRNQQHEQSAAAAADQQNKEEEEEQQQQQQSQESVIEISFIEWSLKLVEKYSDFRRKY